MKRLLQSLMLCGGLVAAGFLAQAAVTSVTAAPATVVAAETEAELGTEENPYTVTDIVALKDEMNADNTFKITGVWVVGYIDGMVNGNSWSDAITGADGTTKTNIVIAPNPTRNRDFLPVQLPKGDVRDALNLVDNPGNVGKKVLLYGNIEKYFGEPGFKSVTEYKFIEEAVAIDYSEFNGIFQSALDDEDEVIAEFKGEGTQYEAEGVVLDGEYGFMIANSTMEKMFLSSDPELEINESNLSCTLDYLDMNNIDWSFGMPDVSPLVVNLKGEYTVKVAYDGEKADVTFVPAGGEAPVVLDYANFALALMPTDEDADSDFVMLEGEGNEYKAESVELNGIYMFFLGDMAAQMRKGFLGEGVITSENPTCTLNYVDLDALGEENEPDFPMLNLSGTYDVNVVYDGTEATVTFEQVGGPAINYADFALLLMNEDGEMLPVTLGGSGNEFTAENVKINSAYNMFVLGDISAGEVTTMFVGDAAISADNLSGELSFYNPMVDFAEPAWPTINLDGTYNVAVAYDGTKANITFEAVPVEIDYSEFSLMFYGEDDVVVALENEGGNIYTAKNIKLSDSGMFMLAKDEKVYFEGKEEISINAENLSCKLYYKDLNDEVDPGFAMPNVGMYELDGTYDITVVYDGTEATVNFVAVTSEVVDINYPEFSLVLFDEDDNMPEFALTGEGNEFVAEGVELNGEYLFMLANGDQTAIFEGKGEVMINDDNMTCTLVYKEMGSGPDAGFGMPNLGQINLYGTYNVYVVYEGTEAIVNFEKQAQGGELSDYVLQLNSGTYYGEVTENGILYKNIKVEGEDYLQVYDNFFYEHYYGGASFDEVVIDGQKLTATLVESDWTPAVIELMGYYDVLVKISDDMKSADVTFTFKGGLKANICVVVEGATMFAYAVDNFTDVEFLVATTDSHWTFDSYTLNGETVTLDKPVSSYTVNVNVNNDCDFLFVPQYNGEIKFLDETTGMVEFEDSAVQIKLVNGRVEIENLTPGEEVMVYSVSGQIIGSYAAHNTSMSIELEKGIYVVRAGKVAAKVSL